MKNPKQTDPVIPVTEPEDTSSDTAIISYTIAEGAPPYIAGIKVGERKTIELTEEQARSELLSGHILMPVKASEEPA